MCVCIIYDMKYVSPAIVLAVFSFQLILFSCHFYT